MERIPERKASFEQTGCAGRYRVRTLPVQHNMHASLCTQLHAHSTHLHTFSLAHTLKCTHIPLHNISLFIVHTHIRTHTENQVDQTLKAKTGCGECFHLEVIWQCREEVIISKMRVHGWLLSTLYTAPCRKEPWRQNDPQAELLPFLRRNQLRRQQGEACGKD